MKRILLFGVIATLFLVLWASFRQITIFVVGQPTSTGALQQKMETPFFTGLRDSTGLPIQVTYLPLDSVGYKDTYQLSMLKSGQIDLVSLRFVQNSHAEPSLEGIDLPGMNSDWRSAQAVVDAYFPTVNRYIEEAFSAKLLGVWPFGPQIFFCAKPIKGVEDLKSLKVRVANDSLARLIRLLGGTAAIIPFDDTKAALANGLVDCAVTSAASGNAAGWPEHTKYLFPLAVNFGLNGYAISLKKWGELTEAEQLTLQRAVEQYVGEIWSYSQDLDRDAIDCNTGQACHSGSIHEMILSVPATTDIQAMKRVADEFLLPEWFAKCNRIRPGCEQEWQKNVLSVTQ